jgi:TonB-linked SusC/RagA family outer membrane protein
MTLYLLTMHITRRRINSALLFIGFLFACLELKAQDRDSVTTGSETAGSGDTIVVPAKAELPGVIVTGMLIDASTGKSLPGISVKYKNRFAAITDTNGNFSLKVPDYHVAVSVQGGGYQSKEIALKGRNRISAALYEDTYNSFYDYAQLPSGAKLKSQTPYSVTSIQTQGAWDRSFETPDSYLQGKVVGLNATRRSGTPNVGANLFLRGYNSLYTNSQPLVVIDGVIFDNRDYGSSLISGHYNNPMAYLDIKDIDNITVIKDGGSIYGTKGANGVILITTARAKDLATKIDFSVYGGINFSPSQLPLLNASDYRVHLAQVLQTSGQTDAQIQSYPYMNDNPSNPDYYRYHYNTDWQKKVMDNSYAQNYYLKVTGGDNIAKYALSVGFMKNAGVIKTTDLKRYNMRFNADLNLSQRLTANTNLSIIKNEQTLKDQGAALKTNPLLLALIKAPLLPVNEVSNSGIESPAIADRDTFNVSNPVAAINGVQEGNSNYRFLGSIGFTYSVSKSVSLATTFGLTKDQVRENMFVPRKGIVNDTLPNAIGDSRSGSQVKRLFSVFNDTRVSYNKTLGDIHNISAQAGFRFLQMQTEQDFGRGFNSATDELVSVGNGLAALRRVGGDIGESRWLNNYFNLDYNLSDKYFLSLNLALDGSSRFGSQIDKGALTFNGNQYAVMPSLAAAWLLSSEKFMAAIPAIELFKLRGSVSISGNDDIGDYAARQYYVSQNFLGIQGLVRGNFGNPQLQWERMKKFNAGADISLFNERINLSVDLYRNGTDNMIINQPTPAATGMINAVTNSGGMKTNGIEASFNARIINKADFKWDAGFNVGHYKSVITRLPVDSIVTNFAGAEIITKAGGAPNAFYGYRSNGVFESDAQAAQIGYSTSVNANLTAFRGGDVWFNDVNGDKIIDAKDKTVIGDPNPDFTGAFTNRLQYKKWSLDALFTFSSGNDIYNYVRSQLENGSGYNNQTPAIINSWRKNGDITSIPKTTWGDPLQNNRFSDRWIEDGSYLRLRTLSVSYTMPFTAGFLKYAVVYLTGNNLFTLTKYKGYDPEFSASETPLGQGIDVALEPQYKSMQAGIRIGL